jgi:para-aminobenzoate synthetase / 4-amino-4-deoxychorismate lyase
MAADPTSADARPSSSREHGITWFGAYDRRHMPPHEQRSGADGGPDPSQGVFETILIYENEPVELDAHLERLAASVRAVYGEDPPEAREMVISRARGGGLGRLRLTIEPRRASLAATIIVAGVEPANVFPGREFEVALEPLTVAVPQGEHKWADRDPLARAEARVGPASVPLLLSPAGEVLEGSRANVFAVREGRVLTPPLDGRILPGIARRRPIETAAELGIEVHERGLDLAELTGADEVFLTGSIRGVEPAHAIGGTALPPGRETTARIATALRRRWLGGTDA